MACKFLILSFDTNPEETLDAVNWKVCGEMRRIAVVVEEAAWPLLLLVMEPEAGAVAVVIGKGVCVCVYFVVWIEK